MSTVKVAFMAMTPLLALWRGIVVTKALIFGLLFFVITLLFQLFHLDSFRASTFIYTLLFLFMFNLYYGLVWEKKCFTLEEFTKVLEGIIKLFFYFMLLQQFCFLAGISLPILNTHFNCVGHWKFNSLAIEPSQTARLLTVFMYAYLKCIEYKSGSAPSIKLLWNRHRKILGMFLYMMLTMGSGTAMAGLVIVALYFVRAKYLLILLPSLLGIYMLAPLVENEALNRFIVTAEAALSMDTEVMTNADRSAAARVNILIDTINHLDLTDAQTWIGHGVDYKGEYVIVGAIADYGFVSYLFKLLFFFSCCFTGLFSLEVLMFVLLFGMNVGNIAYGWSALMVFSTLKYFKTKYRKRV